jgi:hypothetical protein
MGSLRVVENEPDGMPLAGAHPADEVSGDYDPTRVAAQFADPFYARRRAVKFVTQSDNLVFAFEKLL